MSVRAVFTQAGSDVRLEWGREGVEALAPHCGAMVIIDVLSFCTSVDIAVGRNARVLPLPLRRTDPEAAARANRAGAVLAGPKSENGWSLSPSSLTELPAGTLLALPSPNGATLSVRAAEFDIAVFAGSLRNAASVAKAASEAAGTRPVAVIPAGERWGVVEGPLRPSIEDYLGAGAIAGALIELRGGGSIEARLAAAAFGTVAGDLPAVLADAISGRELSEDGMAADVRLAAELNVSTVAPLLSGGIYHS